MRSRNELALATLLILTTALGACSDADEPDPGLDVSPDTGGDAGLDVTPDATLDTTPDVSPDAEPDADAAPDTEPDADGDATPDADAALDATPDADAALDAAPDADAALDATRDADATPDAIADADADVAPDAIADADATLDAVADADATLDAVADADATPDLTADADATVDVGPPPAWFVDPAALPSGDGNSWDTAFSSLQAAIDAAAAEPRPIWVKAGTFQPEAPGVPVAVLAEGVAIYGGFDFGLTGTAGDPELRTGEFPTVLSGTFGSDPGDFAAHVVVAASDATLDGVTVRDGLADGEDDDAAGACIFAQGVDDFRLINVETVNCQATGDGGSVPRGGAIYCAASTLSISSSSIFGQAHGGRAPESPDGLDALGGGIYAIDCELSITSSLIGGQATGGDGADGPAGGRGGDASGGAIYALDTALSVSSLVMENGVAVGGQGGEATEPGGAGGAGGDARGGHIYLATEKVEREWSSFPWFEANLQFGSVVGGSGGDGANGMDTPSCTDGGAGGDSGLAEGAALYVSGTRGLLLANVTFNGNQAVPGTAGSAGAAFSPCLDGAHGTTGVPDGGGIFYDGYLPTLEDETFFSNTPNDIGGGTLAWFVVPDASPGADGETWETAFATFEEAFDAFDAEERPIWVRTGTLSPPGPSQPVAILPGFAQVYGGFGADLVAREGRIQDRQSSEWTALDGDTTGATSDRSEHVVMMNQYSRLDGFVVRDGYLEAPSPEDGGACVFFEYVRGVTLANLEIRGCTATSTDSNAARGGGLYCRDAVDVTVENVVFDGNLAWGMGPAFDAIIAAQGGGAHFAECSGVLRDVSFSNNTASGSTDVSDAVSLSAAGGDASGGALYVDGGLIALDGVNFNGNLATAGRGGPGVGADFGAPGPGAAGGLARGGAVWLWLDEELDWDSVTWLVTAVDNWANGGDGGNGGAGAALDPEFCFDGAHGGPGSAAFGGWLFVEGGGSPLTLAEGSLVSSNRATGGDPGAGGSAPAGCSPGSAGTPGSAAGGGVFAAHSSLFDAGPAEFSDNEPEDIGSAD
jgi:hypothetical protein